jgi:DNA-binding response OmpR family regulator
MKPGRVYGRGRRVLIWSNEEDLWVIMRDLLDHEGYETIFPSELNDAGHEMSIAATVLDLPFYDASQITIVHSLWSTFPDTPMLILTGHDSDEKVLQSLSSSQAWQTIRKPYDSTDLKERLHLAIENASSMPDGTDP